MLIARWRAGGRYLHRRCRRRSRRQPRHKAARTKELRRCTIRERDRRMRIADGRAGFKDGRRFTKVLEGQQGKYMGYEGRKEGRERSYAARAAGGGKRHGQQDGRWRFLFKRHQRACRKFSPVLVRPPGPRASRGHTRPRSPSTRIHAYTPRVPGRSSGVPGGS